MSALSVGKGGRRVRKCGWWRRKRPAFVSVGSDEIQTLSRAIVLTGAAHNYLYRCLIFSRYRCAVLCLSNPPSKSIDVAAWSRFE